MARHIHALAPVYAGKMQHSWEKCLKKLKPSGETWNGPVKPFTKLFDEVHTHSKLLLTPDINKLTHLIESRGIVHDDWYSLAGFLMHDVYHTSPAEIMQFYITVESQFEMWGEGRLFNRQKEYLDRAFENSETLARQFALPFEFVSAIAKLEADQEIQKKKVNLKELLTDMGLLITGRFANDDYHLAINAHQDLIQNNFIVNVPEDLEISVNRSMLFCVIYNLVKNAAKANSQLHYDEEDQALPNAYYRGQSLKHPRNLS